MKSLFKKAVSIFTVFAILFTLTACGSSSTAGISGKFTGEGTGIHGAVVVEVELKDDKIESVTILTHNETPNISDAAISDIPKAIVENQSVNVDVVSGATVTSNAIIVGATKALESAKVDIEKYNKAVAKTDKEKTKEELTYDVVVIGGGGAGLAAALSASQNGASVLVIEKMASLGGSSILAGGQYNAYDKARQDKTEIRQDNLKVITRYVDVEPVNELHKELIEKVKKQYEEYTSKKLTSVFDSAEFHALQTFEGGDKKGDLELIYTLTQGASESVGWLESIGVEVQDHIGIVTGALWQRTHQFVKPLYTGPIESFVSELNKSDKNKILLKTKADSLIMENGKIVGVKASSDDVEYTIKALKGVIVATGGFARNGELVKKYDTHWNDLDGLGSTNAMGATGDGIIMAQEVNADLVGMEWIQLLPVGNPENGSMSGNISISAANQLFINLNGERFVAEDERRDNLTKALLAQPERKMFILHDAHEYTDGTVKNDFNETIDELVEKGLVVKGETIEELAKNMNVPYEALQKTIDEYNKAVDGQIKDPFNKGVMQYKFDKAPFYAGIRVPTIHHTMGGIKINTNAEVIGVDGNVIPGLYAAGEVTGGIHGANRLGGNALPDTVVFGRIAGKNCALSK